jgi:hypothetical protein
MQQLIVKFIAQSHTTLLNMFRALLCPSSGAISNCRCSLWFPYESGGERVSSRGRFVVGNEPSGSIKWGEFLDQLRTG